MTTTVTKPSKQETKSPKKKQRSVSPTNIGSPRTPLRSQAKKKQDSEQLSDWSHAS
jgi:hypothetical protein